MKYKYILFITTFFSLYILNAQVPFEKIGTYTSNREAGVITCVAISPNEEYIISGSENGIVTLKNIDGREISTLTEHNSRITHIKFSPDESFFVTTDASFRLKVWRIGETKSKKTIRHTDGAITGLEFHENKTSTQLLITDIQGKLITYLFNRGNLEEIETEERHKGEILSLAITPDYLITGGSDKDIKITNWNTGETKTIFNKRVFYLSATKIGKGINAENYLLIGENYGVCLWNLEEHTLINTYENDGPAIQTVSLSKEKLTGVYSLFSKRIVKVFLTSRSQPYELPHPTFVDVACISSSGKFVLTGDIDGTIYLWKSLPVIELISPQDGAVSQSALIDIEFCVNVEYEEVKLLFNSEEYSLQETNSAHNRGLIITSPQKCHNSFKKKVFLKEGRNRCIIVIKDKSKKIYEKRFIINYDAGVTTDYLFAIGIDIYKTKTGHNEWKNLKNAVNDAEGIVKTLTSQYQFSKNNTFELYDENATKSNILKQLNHLKKIVDTNDNLLIFYAGHGTFDENDNRIGYDENDNRIGYWVPTEARDGIDTSDYIKNSTIQKYIKEIKAHGTLIIADACFSADLISFQKEENTSEFRGDNEKNPTGYYQMLEDKKKKKSRLILASGIETVRDTIGGISNHSPFTKYLLDILKTTKLDKLDVEKIEGELDKLIGKYNNVNKKKITYPEIGSIQKVGHEGGVFIFSKKKK